VNCIIQEKSGCLIEGTEQMRELPVFIYTSDMTNRSCTRPGSKYPNTWHLWELEQQGLYTSSWVIISHAKDGKGLNQTQLLTIARAFAR
jgi:hypothetical protein